MFLASLYINKSRSASIAPSGGMVPTIQDLTISDSTSPTKESLLQQAVGAINEAARIQPTSVITLLNTGGLFCLLF